MTDANEKPDTVEASVSSRGYAERLAELDDAKRNSPTLAGYWYWCDKIRELKAEQASA